MVTFLTVLGIVGCGLMAGVFLGFSTSVLPGLMRLPPPDAHRAMRQMNRAILNPLFGLVLGGSTLVCGALVVAGSVSDVDGRWWAIGGATTYLVGAVLVTMAINVPLNNRIEAADPGSTDGEAVWAEFRRQWTLWNHLRTIASTAAVAALAISLAR